MQDSSKRPQPKTEAQVDVIDPVTLQDLRDLGGQRDPSLLGDLIGIFLEEANRELGELLQAWDRCDLGGMTRGADTLASSAATIGATELKRTCKDLQDTIRMGRTDLVRAQLEQCQAAFQGAEGALTTVCKPRSQSSTR